MKIPIAKPFLNEAEAQLAYDTILTNWVTQGPQVSAFEEEFAAYTGAKYAVAVSNCTTALHLSLVVAGIGPGDEVIVPSMSYIATANCVVHAGATPIFAEVQRATYNLDPEDVRKKITPKTKAVIGVHQIGLPCEIDSLSAICKENGLIFIEDAACAAGSSYHGKKIGSHSDYVCFSFHPRKVITTGDGGMITTQTESIAQRLRLLRQHGMSVNDRVRHLSDKVILEEHVEVGYNYRLTDIQAAVGREQLKKLDWIIKERTKIAEQYLAAFKEIPWLELPLYPAEIRSNWQSFSVYLKPDSLVSRNELMQRLLDVGISTRRGVMTSHRELAFTSRGSCESLPISEDACDQSIILPLFVPMSQDEIDYVIHHVKSNLGS
jgi:perosamine synthetase